MTVMFGAHVDQDDPIAHAKARGISAVQIVLGSPQSWKGPQVIYPGGAQALKEAAQANDISLYIHSPYLINVASTNNRVRIPSRKLLQKTVTAATEVGAKGVVVHAGHVSADDDVQAGFDNWYKCVAGLELPIPIFIENTAGGANAMARHLDRIAKLWEAISASENSGQVGFCLDTCHAHAAGEEFSGLVDRIKNITGRIDLVHCNDSRDSFGSGADRHANLGQGQIPPEDLLQVIKDANTQLILETPGDLEGHLSDLDWLRTNLG